MNNRVVIGVDGGGTRLRAALVSAAGELLGVGEAGSGNYHDVGADVVRSNLAAALAQAWAQAGRLPQAAEAIFLGLASVVTPEDHATIRQLVRELAIVPANAIGVDHDLRVGLMGGLGGAPGIVLIAGTGSSCYGRDQQGATWQAGGWGPTLDDPGSSFWLGRRAMVATIREFDGRGPATSLGARVRAALQLTDMRQILRHVELKGMARTEIAGLARQVTEASAEGDAVAQNILAEGGQELATMVATVIRKTEGLKNLTKVPVVVTGGLTSAGKVFWNPLRDSLRVLAPTAEVQECLLPPVLGGALLALELACGKLEPSAVEQLAKDYAATTPAKGAV